MPTAASSSPGAAEHGESRALNRSTACDARSRSAVVCTSYSGHARVDGGHGAAERGGRPRPAPARCARRAPPRAPPSSSTARPTPGPAGRRTRARVAAGAAVAHVAGHAHHGDHARRAVGAGERAVVAAEAQADGRARVGARGEAAGERRVHHGHGRGVRAVAVGEVAPGQERHAERREVAGAGHAEPGATRVSRVNGRSARATSTDVGAPPNGTRDTAGRGRHARLPAAAATTAS
jgi:hypothetical protein